MIRVLFVIFAFTSTLTAQDAIADEKVPWAFNAPRGKGYTIDLTAVEPVPGTPLRSGTTVTFTATVAYDLQRADKGLIIMVFQGDTKESITGDRPQVSHQVTKGSGTVTLTDSIIVPEKAKQIWLFIPLMPDGLETTTGEVTLRWPVGDRQDST